METYRYYKKQLCRKVKSCGNQKPGSRGGTYCCTFRQPVEEVTSQGPVESKPFDSAVFQSHVHQLLEMSKPTPEHWHRLSEFTDRIHGRQTWASYSLSTS